MSQSSKHQKERECAICHNLFPAYKNSKMCSDECKKISSKNSRHKYEEKNKELLREKGRNYQREKRKI